MKTRLNLKLLFILSIGISLISFFLFLQDNKRRQYESFLLQENGKIATYVEKLSKIKNRPDKPDLAAFQNFIMTVDPELKYVPVERLEETYKILKNKSQKKFKSSDDLTWTSVNSTIGGRTRSLMFDPNDENNQKVWAGSVTGGLWVNNNIFDRNSSWRPVNDFWENLSISSITYDPNDSHIFYIGTGEAETAVTTYRESSGRGNGLWKSSDSGENWEHLESTKDFAYITDVKIRNEEGNSVIYVAAVSGNYQGIISQSLPTDGLFRSTDNGQSWEQVLPNIPNTSAPFAPSDIEITENGKIFIGTMPNLNEEGGAFILTSDLGTIDSWSIYSNCNSQIKKEPSYNIPGRVKLTSSPSDPNRIYALLASGSNQTTLGTFKTYICKYILRSNDAGLSWFQLPIPEIEMDETANNWAYLAWHALTAKVDPSNADILYLGGLDLFKSIDGGYSWQQISDWTGMYYDDIENYVHGDQHCIEFQPGSSSNITFCSDGGVFITENGNNSDIIFKERNMNYNTLQFYTAAINPNQNSKHFLGGTQDNGTLSTKGEPLSNSGMISGGDGAYCFINSQNGLITSVYYNSYYIRNGTQNKYVDANSGTFISPADYNEELDALYANAHMFDGVRSDQILRINHISSTCITHFFQINTGTSVPFSAIKIKPGSTSENTILYVGSQSGRLFRVENAQSEPTTLEITDINFPTANISCIDVDATGDVILVTFSNYGVNSVWISYDAGNSWKSIENNLPDIPVRWGLLHTNNPKQVMLATEVGIWISDDITVNGFEWRSANEGLANVRVDMLRMRESDNKVLAATHGRGLYTTDFNSNIPNSAHDLYDNISNLVFPNPTNGAIKIKTDKDNFSLEIYTLSGKKIAGLKNVNSNDFINISQYGKGLRILKIVNENKIKTEKVLVY